jgi:hypothetical protein
MCASGKCVHSWISISGEKARHVESDVPHDRPFGRDARGCTCQLRDPDLDCRPRQRSHHNARSLTRRGGSCWISDAHCPELCIDLDETVWKPDGSGLEKSALVRAISSTNSVMSSRRGIRSTRSIGAGCRRWWGGPKTRWTSCSERSAGVTKPESHMSPLEIPSAASAPCVSAPSASLPRQSAAAAFPQ